MKTGIAAAGNWIIDQVKIVDRYPEEDHLANIVSQAMGTGGSAYNAVINLRSLDADIVLLGIGVVGDDENGNYILSHLDRLNVSRDLVRQAPNQQTSYTDVMTVDNTGRRTFFHHRGANALLCGEDFEFDRVDAKMLHVGYLMLLDELDAPDPADPSRPCAARVLEEAQGFGLKTSLDMVSDLSPRMHQVVAPTLKYVNYFIANELESGALAKTLLRNDTGKLLPEKLPDVAQTIFSKGVHDLVVIHMPEGGFWMERSGASMFQPSLNVPKSFIKGTAGAGDAFCSAILYGLHENWDAKDSMILAVANAAQCLSDPTTTNGLKSLPETLALVGQFGLRE